MGSYLPGYSPPEFSIYHPEPAFIIPALLKTDSVVPGSHLFKYSCHTQVKIIYTGSISLQLLAGPGADLFLQQDYIAKIQEVFRACDDPHYSVIIVLFLRSDRLPADQLHTCIDPLFQEYLSRNGTTDFIFYWPGSTSLAHFAYLSPIPEIGRAHV